MRHKQVQRLSVCAKASNAFQLIGQVTGKYKDHFSLKGKLNVHIIIEINHAYLDYMIMQLILDYIILALVSKYDIYNIYI